MEDNIFCPHCGLGFTVIQDYLEHMRCYLPGVPPYKAPHASDCASWVGETCDCVTAKDATDWRDDWQGQPEL